MQRPTIDDSGLVRALEELEALDDAIDERENLYRAYLDNERTARKLGADPAESLHEAKYTSATGEHLVQQAGTKAGEIARLLKRLQARRRILLGRLVDEGFPLRRWVGHGDSFYQVTPSTASKQDRGPYTLYEIPHTSRKWMVPGEDPEITSRRTAYAAFYNSVGRQKIAIISSVMAMPLLFYGVLNLSGHWTVALGLGLLALLMLVLRDGARALFNGISDTESAFFPPFMEVMPHSGKRWTPDDVLKYGPPTRREMIEVEKSTRREIKGRPYTKQELSAKSVEKKGHNH